MSLLDDMKTALRVTSDDFDTEIDALIGSALYDMERAGVNPSLLALSAKADDAALVESGGDYVAESGGGCVSAKTVDTDPEAYGELENKLVKLAVTCLVKANFGYDNDEAERFMATYDRILNALLNSRENVAAKAETGA